MALSLSLLLLKENANIPCSQSENGIAGSTPLFSEKTVHELLQSPVQGSDDHLIEFSEALKTVAKALRQAAEGKAPVQAEAAEWREKYEVLRARNLQWEHKEQLSSENRTDLDDVRMDKPTNRPALCDEYSKRCCAKYGICSHEVLWDGIPNPDSPVVRKASFKLSWCCKGEQSDQHKHVVSFERGNIRTAERSSKQISLKWESCPRTVLILTKPNSASVRIVCVEMMVEGAEET